MHFPIPAIASILHRISGVVLFLSLAPLLWLLNQSLASPSQFAEVQIWLSYWWMKLILWSVLTATAYHICAGVRHLIMDLGFGESLKAGKQSAIIAIGIALVLSVLGGIWLW
ncbi:Succinate dehydrogenase cytochrome b556 subunit [Vibrio stylophorae]|uniref:Succinate dehydrogenase cytochrome b556 subunit n=2 Tax=Vibrio stylophorae TaxID=659351 RepID=A0ABN8DU76_9VIBR|nr:Succinate dehydrogenase cytochrome b556 subunit [Vibrio stylophorae]